ncbi:Ribosome-binding protein 1 [Babesia ovata]|uniref:Ribosome-binding protein 1 n=1 Tax=Babesia ovata TaxID=189622 RepID=A0A2H6K6W5_9APIC|nr:Ribosome-binding protein 1 [Babesia ovata]GBE58736.1 Ribosome-binding protein 1 [Babesia ovata]
MAIHPPLDTLKNIFAFMEAFNVDGLMPRFLRYYEDKKGKLRPRLKVALANFFKHVSILRGTLFRSIKPNNHDKYPWNIIVDVLLECIPRFDAALHYLLYRVDSAYKDVGGGDWAEISLHSGDLQKFFTTNNGIINGGFQPQELNIFLGKDLVNPLKEVVQKIRPSKGRQKEQATQDYFRDAFLTTLQRPWEFVQTGNVLLLVYTLCRVVLEESHIGGTVKKAFDAEFKKQSKCLDWDTLYHHCKILNDHFNVLFDDDDPNNGGLAFIGRTFSMPKMEVFVSEDFRKCLINATTVLSKMIPQSIHSDLRKLRDYAKDHLYPNGFTFHGNKQRAWKKMTQEKMWTGAFQIFLSLDEKLIELKRLLEGGRCTSGQLTKGPVVPVPEAPKEVIPELKVPVVPPKKPEVPPAKVPEVPKRPADVAHQNTKTEAAKPVPTKTETPKPVENMTARDPRPSDPPTTQQSMPGPATTPSIPGGFATPPKPSSSNIPSSPQPSHLPVSPTTSVVHHSPNEDPTHQQGPVGRISPTLQVSSPENVLPSPPGDQAPQGPKTQKDSASSRGSPDQHSKTSVEDDSLMGKDSGQRPGTSQDPAHAPDRSVTGPSPATSVASSTDGSPGKSTGASPSIPTKQVSQGPLVDKGGINTTASTSHTSGQVPSRSAGAGGGSEGVTGERGNDEQTTPSLHTTDQESGGTSGVLSLPAQPTDSITTDSSEPPDSSVLTADQRQRDNAQGQPRPAGSTHPSSPAPSNVPGNSSAQVPGSTPSNSPIRKPNASLDIVNSETPSDSPFEPSSSGDLPDVAHDLDGQESSPIPTQPIAQAPHTVSRGAQGPSSTMPDTEETDSSGVTGTADPVSSVTNTTNGRVQQTLPEAGIDVPAYKDTSNTSDQAVNGEDGGDIEGQRSNAVQNPPPHIPPITAPAPALPGPGPNNQRTVSQDEDTSTSMHVNPEGSAHTPSHDVKPSDSLSSGVHKPGSGKHPVGASSPNSDHQDDRNVHGYQRYPAMASSAPDNASGGSGADGEESKKSVVVRQHGTSSNVVNNPNQDTPDSVPVPPDVPLPDGGQDHHDQVTSSSPQQNPQGPHTVQDTNHVATSMEPHDKISDQQSGVTQVGGAGHVGGQHAQSETSSPKHEESADVKDYIHRPLILSRSYDEQQESTGATRITDNPGRPDPIGNPAEPVAESPSALPKPANDYSSTLTAKNPAKSQRTVAAPSTDVSKSGSGLPSVSVNRVGNGQGADSIQDLGRKLQPHYIPTTSTVGDDVSTSSDFSPADANLVTSKDKNQSSDIHEQGAGTGGSISALEPDSTFMADAPMDDQPATEKQPSVPSSPTNSVSDLGAGTNSGDLAENDDKDKTESQPTDPNKCPDGSSPVRFGGMKLCQPKATIKKATDLQAQLKRSEEEAEKRRKEEEAHAQKVRQWQMSMPYLEGHSVFSLNNSTHVGGLDGKALQDESDYGPDVLSQQEKADEEWKAGLKNIYEQQKSDFQNMSEAIKQIQRDSFLNYLKKDILDATIIHYSPPEIRNIGIPIGYPVKHKNMQYPKFHNISSKDVRRFVPVVRQGIGLPQSRQANPPPLRFRREAHDPHASFRSDVRPPPIPLEPSGVALIRDTDRKIKVDNTMTSHHTPPPLTGAPIDEYIVVSNTSPAAPENIDPAPAYPMPEVSLESITPRFETDQDPDVFIYVPQVTVPEYDFDCDLDDDFPRLSTAPSLDPAGSSIPTISFNLESLEVAPSSTSNDLDSDFMKASTVGMCMPPWTNQKFEDNSSDIPETELLPSEPPRTVEGMLRWLSALRNQKHLKTMEKCVKYAFGCVINESTNLKLCVNQSEIFSKDVFKMLELASMFSGAVLSAIAPDWKRRPSFGTVNPKDLNQLQEPDACALLCQLRDYVYACHHQLAFLKSQCSRDSKHGGWKDCHYGRDVKVKSPLQAFLTTASTSKFKTDPFDPHNICLKSRINMGFRKDYLPKEKRDGKYISTFLSPLCTTDDPLLILCSYLNCLTRRTPRTTGELAAFFHNAGNVLHDAASELSKLGTALSKPHEDCPHWDHLEAEDIQSIRELRISDSASSIHSETLSKLLGCGAKHASCQMHIHPITYRTYALYSSSFADTYLSWAVYLPERLHDSLQRLRGDLEKHVGPKCASLHQCPDAMLLLYRHGFTPPEGTSPSSVKCSELINELEDVVSGQPIANLMVCMDRFLYKIRKPFLYTVFTLWAVAIIFLAHTMLYRLDLLYLRSHLLRSRVSHLIDVTALLTKIRKMRSLYRVDYFDDDDDEHGT